MYQTTINAFYHAIQIKTRAVVFVNRTQNKLVFILVLERG